MKHILLILACVLGMSSCRNTDTTTDDLVTAEQAVAGNDYRLARSICESFTTDSTTTLSVGELCRLSLIYMKMSDIDETDVNTAAATQCYQRALAIDVDSARLYYDNVPIDDARHVEIMSQLNRILSGSRDIYLDEDSIDSQLIDSIINTEYAYDHE